MAFLTTGLDVNASGSKGATKIHTYETTDALAVVEGAGYFNSVNTLLKNGDLIIAEMSDGTKLYRTTVATNVVTLNAINGLAAMTDSTTGTVSTTLGAIGDTSTVNSGSAINNIIASINADLNKIKRALGLAG